MTAELEDAAGDAIERALVELPGFPPPIEVLARGTSILMAARPELGEAASRQAVSQVFISWLRQAEARQAAGNLTVTPGLPQFPWSEPYRIAVPSSLRIPVSYLTGAEPESLLDLISGDRYSRNGYLTRERTGLAELIDEATGKLIAPAECGEVTLLLQRDATAEERELLGRDRVTCDRPMTAEELALTMAAQIAGYPDPAEVAAALRADLAPEGKYDSVQRPIRFQSFGVSRQALVAALTSGDGQPIADEIAPQIRDRLRAGQRPPDIEVTGGATGIKVTASTPPTRIGKMTVSGPGSVGIDLGDDE